MSKVVSVVIPTLNEEKFLGRILDCLKNQTFRDFEVIVADARSKDKTRQIAKKAGATIVDGGHQAMGRNRGALKAKGNILLFLDADVSFGSGFLENCYLNFVSQKLDLACCYFETRPMSLKMKMIYGAWNSSKFLRRKTKTPDGEGQCIWVKKGVFEKLGGFDENLKIAEDVDFIHRAAEKGFKFDILNFRFLPSDRRYKKVGILRVGIGSLAGGIMQILGVVSGNRFSQNVYGGWGKYN